MINLLENDIKLSCEEMDIWYRRFRDMVMYKGSSSPFDYLLWNGKKLVGIEAKMVNDKAKSTNFPFNRVSDDQREGLLDIDKYTSSFGYLLINFRWLPHKGRTFAMPIKQFLQAEKDFNNGVMKDLYPRNTKSLPLEWFEDATEEIERLNKGWNLWKLLM
ncbi:MAG: hypothetical protein ACOCZ5_02660 [bacterium]